MSACGWAVRRMALASVVAAAFGASAHADLVTWTGVNGSWHVGGNWDTGNQPVQGDDAVVNGGTIEFWGGSFGGMNSAIRNDSTVTLTGGTVQFQGSYGANIGTGGSGTASSLTINGGAYNMGGNLNIGNATGETGTLAVGPGGSFDAGNLTWVQLRATGTIYSGGTIKDIGDLDLLGGVVHVSGGSFSANRVKFESNATQGQKINIAGGSFNVGSGGATDLAYGNRYFNFTPSSVGTLTFSNLSTTSLSSYLTSGYVRLNGLTDPTKFVVSSFGANGSQVALVPVPEPTVTTLLGIAGIGVLARRRRDRVCR